MIGCSTNLLIKVWRWWLCTSDVLTSIMSQFPLFYNCRLKNEQWAHHRVGFERWQWVWAGAPPHTWLLSTKPELWVTPKTSSILIPPSCPSHIFEHLHKVQSVLMSLRISEIWNLEGFRMQYLKLEFDIEDEISQVGLRYPICNDQSEKGSLPLTTSTGDQLNSCLLFICFLLVPFMLLHYLCISDQWAAQSRSTSKTTSLCFSLLIACLRSIIRKFALDIQTRPTRSTNAPGWFQAMCPAQGCFKHQIFSEQIKWLPSKTCPC